MRSYRSEYQAPAPTQSAPVVTSFRPRSVLRPPPAPKRADLDATILEAEQLFRDTSDDKGAWARAQPRHFVALYWTLHTRIHGVEPGELREQRTWNLATVEAAFLLAREFNGDAAAMAHFMSWTWAREHRSSARGSSYRTGWRRQFSAALVTDYRVAMKQGRR